MKPVEEYTASGATSCNTSNWSAERSHPSPPLLTSLQAQEQPQEQHPGCAQSSTSFINCCLSHWGNDRDRMMAEWANQANQVHQSNQRRIAQLGNLPPLPDGITAHPVAHASPHPVLHPSDHPVLALAALRRNTKSPGRFECPRCGKVYRWKGNLKQHINVECGKEPQLQCPYCPHRCKHKSSMNRHMKHLHAWDPTHWQNNSPPGENGRFMPGDELAKFPH